MHETSLKFKESIQTNPCSTCDAPCCRIVMIPIKIPVNLMDLDYVRYLLNFSNLEVAVTKTGTWALLLHEQCNLFDANSSLCKTHGTADQPLTCKYYNPHQCWYQTNFSSTEPNDIYILNQQTFNHWIQLVNLGEGGNVISAPSFEESVQALAEVRGQDPHLHRSEVIGQPTRMTEVTKTCSDTPADG